MAAKSLARRNVAVGLYPHTARDRPSALADPLPNLLEHFGLGLLDPAVIAGARARENIIGVFLHSVQRASEGRADERKPLGRSPLPDGVEVGVCNQMVSLFQTDLRSFKFF